MSKFDLEFKKMIVDLYLNGESVSKLTREYEISKASIYKWKEELGDSSEATNQYELKHNEEYRKMQKELASLREENEILKKCVTIFSKK